MAEPSLTAWATVDDLPASTAGMHTSARWSQYLDVATAVLWAASGRRWRGMSGTPVTVELRAAPPRPGEGAWPYHRSWGSCGCRGSAMPVGHPRPVAVRLPHSDVTEVVSVTVDAAPFTGWRLDGAWLARVDGDGWVVCGDRTVVVYRHGLEPPVGGVAACVALAVEFGRADSDSPDRPCRLPQRLQSVSRQGITYSVLDDLDFLDKGLTGLYQVDLWLKSVNPKNRAQPARVWSPDLPRARRTS